MSEVIRGKLMLDANKRECRRRPDLPGVTARWSESPAAGALPL